MSCSTDDKWSSHSQPSRGGDTQRVLLALRNIEPSTEPAMVFSHLAAVLVPAVCDDVVIDLVEGDHGYRIRRPAAAAGQPGRREAPNGQVMASVPDPLLAGDSVTVAFAPDNFGRVGPPFAGVLVCHWRDGITPTPADAALIELMVDHAVGLVRRERDADAHWLGATPGTGAKIGRRHSEEAAT